MLKNSSNQENGRLPSLFGILINGLGLSQEEACHLFSVRKKTLRQWIYNHREPPFSVMEDVRSLSTTHIKRISHMTQDLSEKDPVFTCSRTDEEALAHGWLSLSNERHALSSVCSLCLLHNKPLPRVEYHDAS